MMIIQYYLSVSRCVGVAYVIAPPLTPPTLPTRENNTDSNPNTVSNDGETKKSSSETTINIELLLEANNKQVNKHFRFVIVFQSGALSRFWFLKILSGRQKSSKKSLVVRQQRTNTMK